MTYPGDLTVLRALDLVGQPVLGGQVRGEPSIRAEHADAPVKGGWPTYIAGGRRHVQVRIEAVEVDKDDPVTRALKADAIAGAAANYRVELATGDQYSAAWVVSLLTYTATSGDVQRVDCTLTASGPVTHSVA